MVVARYIDQLHVDPNAAARFLHASLEHVGNAELAADFRQILRPAAIALGRGPRDHLQIADLGQPGQNFVLDTVGKIRVSFSVLRLSNGRTATDLAGIARAV